MPVATLALIIASVGGVSAYAGATIGTSDIQNNAVTSAKIADKTVKTVDLNPAARVQNWAWHPGGARNEIWPTSGIIHLGTKTIKAPATGMLEVSTLATDLDGMTDVVIALVDYNGNLADALTGASTTESAKLYNALGAAQSLSGGSALNFPKKVSKGTHTIKWFAVSYDDANDGMPVALVLRLLRVQFTPGFSGQWQNWTLPPASPRMSPQHLERLLGR